MELSEIDIGKTEQSKLEAVSALYGREVILKDAHSRWIHGNLKEYPVNTKSYRITTDSGTGLLSYENLEELLVVR